MFRSAKFVRVIEVTDKKLVQMTSLRVRSTWLAVWSRALIGVSSIPLE